MGSTKPFSFQNAESDSGIGFGGSSDAPSRAPNFDAGRAASQDFAQRYPGWTGLPSEGGRDGFGGAGGSYLGDAVGRGMTNDPDDVLQASTFLSDNGFLNGPQTEADETFFKGIEDGQKALNKANDGGIQIDGVVKPSGPTEITTQRGVTAGVFNANSGLKMKNDLLAKDGLAPPLNPPANKSAETRLQEGLAKRNPTQSEQMSTIRAHKEVKAKEDAAQQRANAARFQKEKSLADENREISERLARLNKRREARKTPAQKAMETLQKQNQAATKKAWNDMVQRAVASQKRRNIDPKTGRPRVDPAQPAPQTPQAQAAQPMAEQQAPAPNTNKSRIPDTPHPSDRQASPLGVARPHDREVNRETNRTTYLQPPIDPAIVDQVRKTMPADQLEKIRNLNPDLREFFRQGMTQRIGADGTNALMAATAPEQPGEETATTSLSGIPAGALKSPSNEPNPVDGADGLHHRELTLRQDMNGALSSLAGGLPTDRRLTDQEKGALDKDIEQAFPHMTDVQHKLKGIVQGHAMQSGGLKGSKETLEEISKTLNDPATLKARRDIEGFYKAHPTEEGRKTLYRERGNLLQDRREAFQELMTTAGLMETATVRVGKDGGSKASEKNMDALQRRFDAARDRYTEASVSLASRPGHPNPDMDKVGANSRLLWKIRC